MNKTTKIVIGVLLILLITALGYIGKLHSEQKIVTSCKCVTVVDGVRVAGLWCPHCIIQKPYPPSTPAPVTEVKPRISHSIAAMAD